MQLLLRLLLLSSLSRAAQPIYEYLRGLCPEGFMPITNRKSVMTCEESCPTDARCIQGICCAPHPTCKDSSYATTFPCLPATRQNCPKGTRCTPSSRQGQYICCSHKLTSSTKGLTLSTRGRWTKESREVCPASHPVALTHPHRGLMLCNECSDGICVQFRRSDVMICCQSHEAVCGEGSQVEKQGPIAVDCSIDECSSGFECQDAPSGQKVCCAQAVCENGQRATRVCAGGCTDDEKCEKVNGERWCCPLDEDEVGLCPDGSSGISCSPISSKQCSKGYRCMKTGKTKYSCCREEKRGREGKEDEYKKGKKKSKNVYEEYIECLDGSPPLSINGITVKCPLVGMPCLKSGYSCQETLPSGLHCCRREEFVPRGIEEEEERGEVGKKKDKSDKGRGKEVENASSPQCPFSYEAARSILNGKIRECNGFLDLSCPLGYTCMPSSTTATFICCMKTIRLQ